MVRHRFLVPACKGSNPFTPDYEHPIGFVKNELTTTGEAARARENLFPGMMLQYFLFLIFFLLDYYGSLYQFIDASFRSR